MLKLTLLGLITIIVLAGTAPVTEAGDDKVPPVLNFKMEGLDGKTVDLAKFKGKVVLFVNVASECGLTPQYKGLQALHKKYAGKGLVIVGVPSNDFGMQEPGTNKEIAEFCTTKYGVEFVMLAKVKVKGPGQAPLYKYLTSKETNPKFGGAIKWNFDKFLVGRDGTIVTRFTPETNPESKAVIDAIEAELAK
jgi:glutathione peroxidase